MSEFAYANTDAATTMGLLKPYDDKVGKPGFVKSVVDKVEQQYQADVAAESSGGDGTAAVITVTEDDIVNQLPQDEQDAYHWYESNVVANWDEEVAEYNTKDVKPPTYDQWDGKTNDPNWKGKVDPNDLKPGTQPPAANAYTGGSDNSGGDMGVSTAAIKYMAAQIDAFVPNDGSGYLLDRSKEFNGLVVKPGGFGIAESFRQQIVGADGKSGIAGDTGGILSDLHHTMFQLSANLKALADKYDKAEDFNKMSADDLSQVMGDTWDDITHLNAHGKGTGNQ